MTADALIARDTMASSGSWGGPDGGSSSPGVEVILQDDADLDSAAGAAEGAAVAAHSPTGINL